MLASFAFAQPLFAEVGPHPEVFAVRGSTRVDVLVLALVLTLVPAACLLGLGLVLGLVRSRLEHGVQFFAVAAGFGLVALQVLNRVVVDHPALVLVGSAWLGAVAAWAYARGRPVRAFLTALTPAPVAFVAVFVFVSPAAQLPWTRDGAAAPAAKASAAVPVVVVVFDELPVVSLMDGTGRIDRGRFPAFARLARESTWYRNTSTVHEYTAGAVPALLTGRLPPSGRRAAIASNYPRNLFTSLAGTHRLRVIEPYTRLCPETLCERPRESLAERVGALLHDAQIVYGHLVVPEPLAAALPPAPQGWTAFDGSSGRRHTAREADAGPHPDGHAVRGDAAFEGLLRQIRRDRRAALYFVHALLPHHPWQYLPSGERYVPLRQEWQYLPAEVPHVFQEVPEGRLDGRWARDPWLVAQAQQHHLLQTVFADSLLARVLARLEESGLYDRALLVVAADHGVAFAPGEAARTATRANLEQIAFVPLFVKEPLQRAGGVVDTHARLVDVLPTIADVLDLPADPTLDGRSLLREGPAPREVAVRTSSGQVVAGAFRELVRRRDAQARRQARTFGSGDAASLYAFGPRRDLIGKPVSAIRTSARRLAVRLDNASLLRSFRRGDEVVPSHLSGRLLDAAPGRLLTLAVVVNERVAATTQTVAGRRWAYFSALAPPDAFRSGANTVEVFAVPAGR